MKNHYLLALLLHPLLAPAQAGPPVNLRAGQVVRMQTGDVPVDVAVINMSQQSRQPGFAVAAQGSNRLVFYLPRGNGAFRAVSGLVYVFAGAGLVPARLVERLPLTGAPTSRAGASPAPTPHQRTLT